VVLVEPEEPPDYQRLGEEAAQLRALGLSYRRIGERLGVTDKTVRRAVAWRVRRQGV